MTLAYITNGVFEVTWKLVDCAQLYIVEIPDLGVRQVLEGTNYTTPSLPTGVNYPGWVSAFGGSPSLFTVIGGNLSSKF